MHSVCHERILRPLHAPSTTRNSIFPVCHHENWGICWMNFMVPHSVLRAIVYSNPARGTCQCSNAATNITATRSGWGGGRHLQHDSALPLVGVPHPLGVVDAVAPLVHQQRGGVCVSGLHPVGEQPPLRTLIPARSQRSGKHQENSPNKDGNFAYLIWTCVLLCMVFLVQERGVAPQGAVRYACSHR